MKRLLSCLSRLALGLACTAAMSSAQAFVLFGTGVKWGDAALGTPGGTVSYSFVGAGTPCGSAAVDTGVLAGGFNCRTTDPVATFGPDFERIFGNAFAAWSQWADIDFVQVADDGFPSGSDGGPGHAGQIRIGTTRFVDFNTFGVSLFGPSGSSFGLGGDIFISNNLGRWSEADLTYLAVHEIGHSLGLAHSDVLASVMSNSPLGARSIQADDIAAIQAVYGPRATGVPEPGSLALMVLGLALLWRSRPAARLAT